MMRVSLTAADREILVNICDAGVYACSLRHTSGQYSDTDYQIRPHVQLGT